MEQDKLKIHYLNELISLFKTNLDSIEINETAIWSNTGWAINSRWASFEIYYLIDGSTKLQIEDKVSPVQAGDIFFVDNSLGNSCKNGRFTIFGLNYTINQHKDKNHDLYRRIQNCYMNLSGAFFKMKRNIPKEFCLEITKEHIVKHDEYELNIKLLVLQFLIKILRAAGSDSDGNSQNRYSEYSVMVSTILLYVSENLDRDISLAEISKMHNLSPRYINRIFKGVTGYPIIQYQQHLKVEKAKRLLSSSSLSILDIAMELNFGSSQYLSYIFKKVTGMSPGEFRKMHSRI